MTSLFIPAKFRVSTNILIRKKMTQELQIFILEKIISIEPQLRSMSDLILNKLSGGDVVKRKQLEDSVRRTNL